MPSNLPDVQDRAKTLAKGIKPWEYVVAFLATAATTAVSLMSVSPWVLIAVVPLTTVVVLWGLNRLERLYHLWHTVPLENAREAAKDARRDEAEAVRQIAELNARVDEKPDVKVTIFESVMGFVLEVRNTGGMPADFYMSMRIADSNMFPRGVDHRLYWNKGMGLKSPLPAGFSDECVIGGTVVRQGIAEFFLLHADDSGQPKRFFEVNTIPGHRHVIEPRFRLEIRVSSVPSLAHGVWTRELIAKPFRCHWADEPDPDETIELTAEDIEIDPDTQAES